MRDHTLNQHDLIQLLCPLQVLYSDLPLKLVFGAGNLMMFYYAQEGEEVCIIIIIILLCFLVVVDGNIVEEEVNITDEDGAEATYIEENLFLNI